MWSRHVHGVSALPLVPNPKAYARLLQRVHEAVLSGTPAPARPRPIISASWRRSLAAGVDPDRQAAPIVLEPDAVRALRERHPLAAVMPVVQGMLASIALEARHIVIVTDSEGAILWREGHPHVQRIAERSHLVEGARWSEDAAGTNAMGTALAEDRPVQVHSAEHLVRQYHRWTCAAAPVHDPDTGEILGTIDVTGPVETAHPSTVALVAATARLAEQELRRRLSEQDARLRERAEPFLRGTRGALLAPSGRVLVAHPEVPLPERLVLPAPEGLVTLPDGRTAVVEPLDEGLLLRVVDRTRAGALLRLRFLAGGRPRAWYGGRELDLSLRHAEILALLALYPGGLKGEELAWHLYGDYGNPVTVRAEVHRLRHLIGNCLDAKPYRITARVDADFLTVRERLRKGDVAGAVDLHRYPLLPHSEAPTIRDEREQLIASVRGALLARGDAEALLRWSETPAGADDPCVHARLLELLPRSDPRRAAVAARAARLREPGDGTGS